MKAILCRSYSEKYTKGTLFIMEGSAKILEIKTLELPNLGNQHDISCIPEGTYKVTIYNSPTKGNCFKVLDVPGRSDILIHKGNFVTGSKVDSKGCILVGLYFADINADGFPDVAESTQALRRLLAVCDDSFELVIL